MARVGLFDKDPAAVLDYKWDWRADTNNNDPAASSDWLEAGETISSHTVTAETGLTVDSSALADTSSSVVAWLSGGTAGETYLVTCQIVTTNSRTDERTITVKVRQR